MKSTFSQATTGPKSRKKLSKAAAQLSVAAIATLVLAGCGVGETVDRDEGSAAGDSDARVLRLAHVYEANHPVETCGVETLNEELEGSGITIQSYPAGQLGSEEEALEQVATGGLEMTVAGPSFLGVWHEPAAVLDAAYLFDDVDHFVKTVEGPTMDKIYEDLNDKTGLKVLSTWYYGTRQVTANRPIQEPEDMNGLKIRTPNAPLYLKNIKAMGGTATPMALGEVYLALQQGVIDAQENPIPTIATAKLNEVQDYISLTGHMIQGVNLVTNSSVFDSLEDDQATALEDAMEVASDEVRKCIETQEEEILAKWKDADGIEVVEDVNREAFAKQVKDVLPDQVSWGELYKEIQASK